MKSDFDKAKETLEKQGVKIEIKEMDQDNVDFTEDHINTLFNTLPSDKNTSIQYFTLDGELTTKASLRDGRIMDFKIKDTSLGEFVAYKDCCPIFDKPFGEISMPITTEREKINMPSFDTLYAYDISHGIQQMDTEMASYFQNKGIMSNDITDTHIKQMRSDLKRTWHETTDQRAQLVSRELHQKFRHPGGVADTKFNMAMASRAEKLPSVDSSYLKSSSGEASFARVGKLFDGVGDTRAASGSSVNWGKIIISIIAVIVVLALVVGTVVLLAKVLPPVFEAIGNFLAAVGQFFVNMWNGICNFFGAIGRFFANIGQFFVNLWNGITNFFKVIFSGGQKLEFDTLDNGETYYVVNIRRTMWGNNKDNYIDIPETYNGAPVVGIGENAFANNVYLVELHIPSSIEWIEINAFNDCEVQELYIEDIEAWVKIDFRRAEDEPDGICYSHPCNYIDNRTKDFENRNFIYLNGEKIDEIVIPSSVTEISDFAFYNFTGIDKFIIPDSVSKIGDYAFARDYFEGEYWIMETINKRPRLKNNTSYRSYWDITFDGTISEWRTISKDRAFSAPQGVVCEDGTVAYLYDHGSTYDGDKYHYFEEIIEKYEENSVCVPYATNSNLDIGATPFDRRRCA